MNKQKYFIVSLSLDIARTKSEPYELRTDKDSLFVLTLSGNASISIDHNDFFSLGQNMRIKLERETRKEIEVINTSQPGKNLIIFVGTQKKCQITL